MDVSNQSPSPTDHHFSVPSQPAQQNEPMAINGQNYAAVVLSDVDLRCLSPKLVNQSVPDIGRCLGLDESFIRQIEDDSTQDEEHKRHQLLTEWSHHQASATWGKIASCFKSLNDDSLMEDIRQIARDMQKPEEEGELHRMESTQSRTDPESSDANGDGAFAVDKAPTQVQSKDKGQMVVSRNRATEKKPNPVVRQKLDKLQDEFRSILLSAQDLFESHAVPLKKLRLMVTSLCVDQEQNIPMFNQSMLEVIDKSSCEDIFTFMTRMQVWDALNFQVLQKILKQFIPNEDEVHKQIDEYASKVEKFKEDTTLQDYIRVRASGPTVIPGYRTVMFKVDQFYHNFTLANVAKEEAFLANQFLLHQFIFRLKDAGRGCVQITWLVPASAVPLLMPEKLAEKGEALKKRKMLEIRVDDQYVYMNPNPQEAPRKLFPYLQSGDYDLMYKQSVEEPEKFWAAKAEEYLEWDQMFTAVSDCNKEEGIVKWFIGGKLNVSKNCLDRHAAKNPDRTAIIWEMNEQKHEIISYSELLEQTCRVANVLKNQCGVKKGDVVVIYMPTMPLAVASMLACARIGAVHSVVFAAFKPEQLKERIIENAKVLITANEAPIEDHVIPLKRNVDEALKDGTTSIQHVLVAQRTERSVPMSARDISLEEAMKKEPVECEPEPMDSEEDLFIMYTSGTTGFPTGVVHTQAGYLLYAALTHKYVFDYKEGDVFACVAVLGWITGHTYVVYGPLCNGATTVLFEGTATYPNESRYWEMVQRLKVNQFYTTPSAIRKLMKAGDEFVKKYDLSSLKTIGSVGEPLSTASWKWYFNVVGNQQCILVDTWWQTETGGIAISPQPGPSNGNLKPGCPMRPFFGVEPVLTNEKGDELEGNGVQGLLCLRNPTPGMCRRIISSDKGLKKNYFNYFSSNPGLYFTQDYAYRDVEGHYQIQGRKDDIIRIKGVWLQVPEIESKIVLSDRRIEEATIVPFSVPKKQKDNAKCDSMGEDTAVLVQVSPDIKEEEREKIAENVKCEVLHMAGLRAVPQEVFFTRKQAETYSGKVNRMEIRRAIVQQEEQASGRQGKKKALNCTLSFPYGLLI